MSTRPRDIVGAERGQTHREAIRQVMFEHMRGCPLREHLTAKEVQARLLDLGIDLKPSTVSLYMKEIHAGAEAEALRDLALELF
jgi:hypothetical protein